MALIKDICNLASLGRGLMIPDVVGGALASDLPVADVDASSFSALPISIQIRPLLLADYTLYYT